MEDVVGEGDGDDQQRERGVKWMAQKGTVDKRVTQSNLSKTESRIFPAISHILLLQCLELAQGKFERMISIASAASATIFTPNFQTQKERQVFTRHTQPTNHTQQRRPEPEQQDSHSHSHSHSTQLLLFTHQEHHQPSTQLTTYPSPSPTWPLAEPTIYHG